MKIKIQIDKDALIKAFKEFPMESQKDFRIAMKQSAQMIQEEAKDHHDFTSRSNKTEDSIKAEVNSTGTEAKIFIDPNIAPQGIFIHGGTRDHFVKPNKYKALRFVTGNGRFGFSKGHMVSGINPEPFLNNALKEKSRDIQTLFQDALKKIFKRVGF